MHILQSREWPLNGSTASGYERSGWQGWLGRLFSQWANILRRCRSWFVFCDLYLDVAKITLTSHTLTLLLVGIVGFGGAGRTALQATVPVVRYEGLALISLGGAVRVNVINMGPVCLKSDRHVGQGRAERDEVLGTYWSSVITIVSSA